MDNKPCLTDSYGRLVNYIRVSVTDKCNLRCFYCLPKGQHPFAAKADYLHPDELIRILRVFAQLGVANVRLTGGEPLVRKDFPDLVKRIQQIDGINDLSLSTNASLLAEQAAQLQQNGIKRINVSLDSLQAKRFKQITHGELAPVLAGLMAAKEAGFFPIKINMVVMRHVNDDEVVDMVAFCQQHGFTLRFIETMPVGGSGQQAGDHYIDLAEIQQRLAQDYQLVPSIVAGNGPARYFRVNNSALHIGFITPMSQHFCETCNRVRLSVDGTLYLCLGKNHSQPLRPWLRQGIDDGRLQQLIIQALALKPKQHNFNDNPHEVIRFMSSTGG